MLIQEDYFKNIFNTVREGILILDANLRVLSANRSFFTIFKVDTANTIGTLLYDLGNGQWDIPYLRVMLEDILPKNDTVDDYEIEHNFESIGKKTMLLNACKIREKKNDQPIILLAIEDITERKRLEDLLTESEKRYRRVYETANDGIVLLEKREGNIINANPAAEKMLGYSEEESIGKKLEDIGVSLDISDFPTIMQVLDKDGIINYDDVQVKTKTGQYIETDIYMVDRAKLAQCNIRDVSERKRAVDELRASQQILEGIINAIPVRVFWKDKNLVYLGCNAAFARDAGFADPKDIIGKDDYQIGWSDHAELYRNDDRQVIESGVTTFLIEEPLITPEGNTVTLLTSKLPLRNSKGEIIGVLGTYMDITERKRFEKEMNEQRKRFETFFDNLITPLAFLDKDFNFIRVNKAYADAGKREISEFPGHNHFEFYPSDARTIFEEVVRTKTRFQTFAHPFIYADQPEREATYWNWTLVPILDNNGEVEFLAFSLVDVTEQKRADDALRESEERFRQIAESTGEWIWEVDRDGLYTYASDVVEKILGYKPEELIGKKHFYDLFPSDKREQMKKETLEFIATKKVVVKYANANVHKNGNIILIETSGAPILDSRGDLLGYRGVDVDITAYRKLEDQLRHAQKMEAVGTLTGGIAHDFNNILNVIMGYGTMVLDRMEADSLSKEQMNEVLMAAERATNLTRGLLVFSRKQVVEVKPVNINETILVIQKMLVRIIRENIDFKLNLTDSPLIVMADTGQIEQVLMNLATNATDAMPDGGRLTIVTGIQELDNEYVAAYGYGKPGIYALITVTDTGHGMDAETQNKIFEPFFTTKCIGEGTGLGLAISYGIIKQHNGYIKVYSEPGQGAVFKIYLPLVEETAELYKKREAAVSAKGGNETILVAEDDPSLRNLSRIVLESFGYSVITAEDGEDAITKFIEHRAKIALVVLDMIMPKKSGKEAYEEIRKTSPGVKALLMSGYTIDIIKTSEQTEAGFDFIYKPFVPQDFLKKVREVLDR